MTPPEIRVTEPLIRRHQAMVWRFLRFLGAPADLAEDLTQETFLRLLRGRVEDRGDVALAQWLRQTARRLLASHRRGLRPELADATDQDLDDVFVETEGADGGAAYREALTLCVEALAERERELLELRFRAGTPRAEIARRLEIAEEGVKTLLRRVKARLRACIERRMSDG